MVKDFTGEIHVCSKCGKVNKILGQVNFPPDKLGQWKRPYLECEDCSVFKV